MSEMIERVKSAIRENVKVDATGLSPIVASAFVVGIDEAARAAIEAMRDPHPLQLYPGVHAYIEVEKTCRPVAFRAGWNAVIDAALSQDTHSLSSTPGAVNAGIGASPPSDAGTLSEAE